MLRVEILNDRCRASIEGELTIYNALTIKESLMAILEDKPNLEIVLASVTEIDTAGVQILMLAKQEQLQRGHRLTLSHHSHPVLDAFELLNLVGWFNDPVVMTKDHGGSRES